MRQYLGGNEVVSIFIMMALPAAVCVTPLPSLSTAGRSSWLAALIAGAAGCAMGVVSLGLASRWRGSRFLDETSATLGRLPATLLQVALIWYAVTGAAVDARDFPEFVHVYMLPNTPLTVIMGLLVGAAAYAWHSGVEVFGRCAPMLAIASILLLGAGLAAVVPRVDPGAMLPPFDAGLRGIADGVLSVAPFMSENFLLIVLMPYSGGPDFGKKHVGMLSAVNVAVFAATTLAVQSVFGVEEARDLNYVVIELFRLIKLGEFFERTEAAIAIAWLNAVFVRMAFLGWVATTLTMELAGEAVSRRTVSIAVGAAVLGTGLLMAPDFQSFRNLLRPSALPSFVFAFQAGVTLLLLVAGRRRPRS